MTKKRARSTEGRDKKYVFSLYVTGSTPCSSRSIFNIRNLCEDLLWGRYKLQVIDLYQEPGLARREQIIAAPTLIKRHPLPLRKLVGDLSDRDRLVAGLDLQGELA